MNACSLAGLLTLALAGLGHAQEPAPAGESRTAAQLVAELESGSFAEARKGLLALGAREAMPALAQGLAELPPAAAWQVVRVLRELPTQDAPDRLAVREGAKQIGKLVLGEAALERRRIAAFALGALGEHASSIAKDLARRLAEDDADAVRLACVLALSEVGEDALKPLLKLLEGERVTTRALALAALALQGTDKAGVPKAVERLAVRPDSFHAFLLGGVALYTLERCAKSGTASEAASEQRKLLRGRRWSSTGRVNWGGILSPEPALVLEFFTFLNGLPKPRPREYAAPEAFSKPSGGMLTVADGYRQLVEHLVRELEPFRERLRTDGYPIWIAFEAEMRPLVRLAELLHATDSLVPADAKR